MHTSDLDSSLLPSQSPVVRDKVEHFFAQGKSFSYPEKTTLIQADITPTQIHFLTAGVVKQTSHSLDGDEVILNTFKTPAFFPLIQMMTGIPNRHSFISLTPVTGYTRSCADVEAFLRQEPAVLYDLTTRLLGGLDALLTKIELLMVETAGGRVEAALRNLAVRYADPAVTAKPGEFLPMPIPVTHQVLADMTGLTRETVTREIKNLTGAELVKQDQGKLWIKII